MTLINYLTRVHFADGVLEEALRSEMERHGKRRPLIIAEKGHLDGTVAERFFASLPIRAHAQTFDAVPPQATEAAAQDIAALYHDAGCDLLIAYGSNRAMDLSKVARIAIAFDEPIAALSNEEGGAQRIGSTLPDLYSVPGVLGFASAISDYTRVRLNKGGQVLFSSRNLIPTVAICDPTLTLGSTPEETACAAAGILARGVDAYLSPGYNPPADGLALDALGRVAKTIDAVLSDDTLAGRREMMAGGLNSSLSLQKGLCVVHAISNAVASVARTPPDPSLLGGILIPRLAEHYDPRANGRAETVKHVMMIPTDQSLGEGLASLIARMPFPRSLSDLDVGRDALCPAARRAMSDRAIRNGPCTLNEQQVLAILEDAHGA